MPLNAPFIKFNLEAGNNEWGFARPSLVLVFDFFDYAFHVSRSLSVRFPVMPSVSTYPNGLHAHEFTGRPEAEQRKSVREIVENYGSSRLNAGTASAWPSWPMIRSRFFVRQHAIPWPLNVSMAS